MSSIAEQFSTVAKAYFEAPHAEKIIELSANTVDDCQKLTHLIGWSG